MERSNLCIIRSWTLEYFHRPLLAAAVEAQFPFPGKGWPKAGVGTPTVAVRPLPATRNSDVHITTPPYGHPLQASLLFLFARHSKSMLFLCSRSFVKSKIEGELGPHRHNSAVARNIIVTRVLTCLCCNVWK